MRDRAVFRLAKPVPSNAEGTEAGDIGFIVDAAPDVHRDSQADNSGCLDPTVAAKQLNNKTVQENRPLEARSSFQTETTNRAENSGHSEPSTVASVHCLDNGWLTNETKWSRIRQVWQKVFWLVTEEMGLAAWKESGY